MEKKQEIKEEVKQEKSKAKELILPEIKWDEPKGEIEVLGNEFRGTLTVRKGKRFITFKQCLSERERVKHGFIGADEFRDGKDISIDRMIEIQLEKSAFIQEAAFVEWSNEEEISKESILNDHVLFDLRELAIKYILKGSKMGN